MYKNVRFVRQVLTGERLYLLFDYEAWTMYVFNIYLEKTLSDCTFSKL